MVLRGAVGLFEGCLYAVMGAVVWTEVIGWSFWIYLLVLLVAIVGDRLISS